MIALERLVKRFGSHVAVNDVSFSVARGELCAMVGASGSGKSTLLRLINRLIEPDSGAVLLDGEDTRLIDPVILRRRIGYVIQTIGLFPHWTIRRNIATVPRLNGWDAARIAARVDALLDLVGLDPSIYRERYPSELSGGQQQRVGVARALAGDPDLLLMDEPFGALDPINRENLQDELSRIHRATGKTIVLVTHDLDEAIRLADKIAILERGAVQQFGTPREIFAEPANDLVTAFVGGERRGLRLLQVVSVAERLGANASGPAEGPPAGEPISETATLADALAAMVARKTQVLPIARADGAIATLNLSDIVGAAP